MNQSVNLSPAANLKNTQLRCFVFVFLALAAYVLTQPPTELLYDANDYWKHGQSFYEHGYFNFLDYDAATARNYIFPLLLGTIGYVAKLCNLEPVRTFQVLNVLAFSAFGTIVIPSFARELFNFRPKAISILTFVGLMLIFWHGFLLYSLSDLPSLECAITGCLFFLKSRNELRFDRVILAFALLIFAGMTRPAYYLCLPLVVLAFLLTSKSIWRQWRNLLGLALSGAAVLALMISPQIYINHTKPFNSNFSGANLYLFQLAFGIVWEKYETTSGKDLGGEPRVIYCDHIGAEIFAREHLVAPFDFSKFRRVLRKYPMELIAIYGKHVFNGFDLQFPEPYPAKIFGNRLLFAFLNYSIIFISFSYLLVFANLRRCATAALYCAGPLCPIAVAIPGVVEPRFFLPAFVVIYAVFAYAVVGNPKQYLAAFKNPRMTLAYVASMWFAITLSGATMANMYPVTPLFSGVPAPQNAPSGEQK